MKRVILLFFLSITPNIILAQIVLTIEGTEVIDTVTGLSYGVNIPRQQTTKLTYRNNSLTSVNALGYLLQAGDETPEETNNNLDGEVITGNVFTWNGKDPSSMTHALFTGYNINVVIKYNYLRNTPNAIQRKSNGMEDVEGVVAYNILNNPKLGIAVKGIHDIRIFNNTFYSERTPSQTSRGLVDIHKNTDGELNVASTGTKVFNNIFYTKNRVYNIKIHEAECLERFESDYNLFWCEAGEPIFEVDGQTKTFAQWQALGYDLHSVIIDPGFENFTDFVPRNRLDYGTNLGEAFQMGLATDASWGNIDPKTISQNGNWQVGARIFEKLPEDSEITIYPNPAGLNFNIYIRDSDLTYRKLKIYDLKGQLLFTQLITHGLNDILLPDSFIAGIYNITLESVSLKRYSSKLVIIK